MLNPYDIDYDLAKKEKSHRVAPYVETFRAAAKEQDEKPVGGLLASVAVALGVVVAFVRGA